MAASNSRQGGRREGYYAVIGRPDMLLVVVVASYLEAEAG